MGKQNNALKVLAFTSGAGIAVGSNVDLGAIITSSVATTVTVVADGVIQFDVNATQDFTHPAGLEGPVTCTSSGGSFSVLYRVR